MKALTIAIDGYSSTGKSTLAKKLAAHLGYRYVDSGAMYRAVALYGLQQGWVKGQDIQTEAFENGIQQIRLDFISSAETGRSEITLNGEPVENQIRSMEVNRAVSMVSAISAVRKHLVAQQQKMGLSGGVVMDGRDIGTVVFPHAELKLFMTASEDVRAHRRHAELLAANKEVVSLEEVKKNLIERDLQDQNRSDSPLLQAADAVVLDNTHLDRDAQFDWVLQKIQPLLKA